MKTKYNYTNIFMTFVLIFIIVYSLTSEMRVELKWLVAIAFAIIGFSFNKIRKLTDKKENVYYESYIKTVTDTLSIATKEMKYVESVPRIKDKDLLFHLGIITGCQKYLSSINPPIKYEEEHNAIIKDLYYFVEDNKLRLSS